METLEILLDEIGAAPPGPEALLLVLLMAFCSGHIIGWVYMWTAVGLSYSRSFVASLVALPVLVALVMMLMSSSIIIAFSFFAIFAVVRFRNAVKDTRDTTFVFWAVAQGMGVGSRQFGIALLGCLFVGAMQLYLRFTSFGARQRHDAVLTIQQVDGEAARIRVDQVLRRHCAWVLQVSQRDTSGGEWPDRTHRLLMRDPSRGAELLAELEATGFVTVMSLYNREDESEY